MQVALLLLFAASDAVESYRTGVAFLDQHKAAEAIPCFERAVQAEPGNAQFWKALGVARASLDQVRESIEPFRQACTLNQKLLNACYYYGRALYSSERYQDALAPFEKALRADAVKGFALAAIGECNEALGRTAEAEKAFRSALDRRDAAEQRARLAYGRFLIRQARAGDAIPILKAATATGDSRYQLGLALSQADRLEEARAALEESIRLDDSKSAPHGLLAKVYRRLGRPTDAVREEHAALVLSATGN